MFGDPFLIRSGRAYERTVRGDSLLRELESLLPRLESMVRRQDFDPQRSLERFRLAVTDHTSIILIAPLIRRIRSAAPGIRVEVSQWQDRAYEAVIEGRLDAVFSAEHPPSALKSEVLFEVDFVCVVGTSQKVRSPRLSLASIYSFPTWWSRLGRRTNSRGPSAGSVWREAARCPQRSILCGGNVRGCENGPGPDCPAKADKACPANRWHTLCRTA
jgi:DNA-binding transcriptional LysR family regulator